MTDHRARALEICSAQSRARLEYPFGESSAVFKVAAKIFAIVSLEDPARITLKIDPELAAELVAGNESIEPGYHMNKRHWITVELDGSVAMGTVRQLVEDSHDLVAA